MLSLNWQGVLSELPYSDGIVLTSEVIGGLRNKFRKWSEALNVNM